MASGALPLPIGPSDFELIQMIVRGDERAFLTLYDRFASHVYSLTLRILGDSMLAEEVTQDNFLKVMESREAIHPKSG